MQTVSSREAYMLLHSAKAVLINNAVISNLMMDYADGEYSLDIFLPSAEQWEEGDESFSFTWEKEDRIPVRRDTLLLEDQVSGEKVAIQILVTRVLQRKGNEALVEVGL